MPITYTPIRYPGGKSKIYPLIDSIIERTASSAAPTLRPTAVERAWP